MNAVAPRRGEILVEIGPGRGALTSALAARADRVLAFEIDRDLVARLRESAPPNLEVHEGDFLDVTAETLAALLERAGSASRPVRVAGNLPYNAASPILLHLGALYESGVPMTDATVMLQREVADRLLAPLGTKEYGVLSVMIRQRADVDSLLALPPGAFRPSPRVHSSVVRLRFHPPDPRPRDAQIFEAVVRAIFTRRRKTLKNALLAYTEPRRGGLSNPDAVDPVADRALAVAGLDGQRRPETLGLPELTRLADAVLDVAGPA